MTPHEISSSGIYSIDELTDILGIAERHIAAELNHGALDGRTLGKKWFVTGRSLLEYLEPQKHPASTELHPASTEDTENTQATQQSTLHPEHAESTPSTLFTESQRSELQQPGKDIERLTAVLAAVAQTENNAKAAEVLNQQGTPTARGGIWTADSVRKARQTAKNRGLS